MSKASKANLILCIMFCSNSVSAADLRDMDAARLAAFAKKHGRVAEKFVQEVQFSCDCAGGAVTYGNSEIGYFRTPVVTAKSSKISVEILPPTYKNAVQFWVEEPSGAKLLGEKKFESPLGAWAEPLRASAVEGQFSQPFFLMTSAVADGSGRGSEVANIAMIVNRLGEVVWLHFPRLGEVVYDEHPAFAKVAPGLLGVLCYDRVSYFEIVDLRGRALKAVDGRDARPPYAIHHTFIVSPDQKQILTFGQKMGMHGVGDISLLASTIVEVDLTTNRQTELFDPLKFFSPLDEPNYFFTPQVLDPNLDQAARAAAMATPDRWVLFDAPKAHYDWNHGNSLFHVPGKGYLVSFRNNDKLFIVSEDFKKVLATLGRSKKNDYQFADDATGFSGQHDATMLPDGRIMLFDNHSNEQLRRNDNFVSRVGIYKQNEANKTVVLDWDFTPSPPISALARGSAQWLDGKAVLALFASQKSQEDNLFEVEYPSKKVLARMKLKTGPRWTGYKAEGQNALGQETYLGMTR